MEVPLIRRAGGLPEESDSECDWADSAALERSASPPRCSRLLPRSGALCLGYVLLSASGPILLDWVKQSHGGRFHFSVAALTFHAWAIASGIGFAWTWASAGRTGLRQMYRPDLMQKFCIPSALFAVGDMLSFMSMQRLDVGTFSLLGKSSSVLATMVLSRLILRKTHTRLQYCLVGMVAAATVVFCNEEQLAQGLVIGRTAGASSGAVETIATERLVGLAQRTGAVFATSLGAVLQEQLFTREPSMPFMMQLCLMGLGAILMSLLTLQCSQGSFWLHLADGFDDWRVSVLLAVYILNGVSTGLVVKRLGAVAKALCVPVYLGGCYLYAVLSGSAVLTLPVVLAWTTSTACVLVFAMTKAAVTPSASVKAEGRSA